MESLFAEVDARLRREAMPFASRRASSARSPGASRELAALRAAFFERIAPYKRSGNAQSGGGPFMRAQHAELVRRLRAALWRWLPELGAAPAEVADALELVTSFEAWERLRADQRLGRASARARRHSREPCCAARSGELERSDLKGEGDGGTSCCACRRARLALQPQDARRAALPAHPVTLDPARLAPRRAALPRPRVELIPQLMLPGADGELAARIDSTPLIRGLEREYAGRSVVPPDPGARLPRRAARGLRRRVADQGDVPLSLGVRARHRQGGGASCRAGRARDAARGRRRSRRRAFAARQIGRLGVVGSNATTAPVIEASYAGC